MLPKIFNRTDSGENDAYCGISLGDKARDTLTGFTGIIVARSEHLTGCNQVYVLPRSEKDNETKKGEWFDIERIEKLGDLAVEISARRTGSDIPAPRAEGGSLRP